MISTIAAKPGSLKCMIEEAFSKINGRKVTCEDIRVAILQSAKFIIADSLIDSSIENIADFVLEGINNRDKKYDIWRTYGTKLPYPKLFLQTNNVGFLLQQESNGDISVITVTNKGTIHPVISIISARLLNTEIEHPVEILMSLGTEVLYKTDEMKTTFDNMRFMLYGIAVILYEFITYINARNTVIIEYTPKKKELPGIAKALYPLYKLSVVKITKERKEYKSLEEINRDINSEENKHIRKHLVRGHFKQCKSGLYWWSPFIRYRNSEGVVDKTYVVE